MPFGFQETKKKPEEKKPTPQQPDMVKRVQEASERQRRADEEKKRKGKVETAPEKGVLSRMYDLFMGSSEKKK